MIKNVCLFWKVVGLLLPSIYCFSCTDSNDDIDNVRENLRPSLWDGVAVSTDVLDTYDYPDDPGQALTSDYFEVSVKVDDGEYIPLDVLMSDPTKTAEIGREYSLLAQINNNGVSENSDQYAKEYTSKRSFSFVNVSYDNSLGSVLTFKIKPKGLGNISVPIISPRSYNLTASATTDGSYEFVVNRPNQYISVDFKNSDNILNVSNGSGPKYQWLKHMLCIFVDPKEPQDKPLKDDPGVVVFSDTVSEASLSSAGVIYFPRGHYNLQDPIYNRGAVLNAAGALILKEGQHVYIEGGAFVEGLIYKKGSSNYGNQIKVTGRGILTGRRYLWDKRSGELQHNGIKINNNLIHGGQWSHFEGIMIMEAPSHGIVSSGDGYYKNVKMLGWHCNNDGFRPGENTRIENCFLRACDDFFYNYNLQVTDCVLWPMFNGSILTYGWQDINLGGSYLHNIDIINPEWISMGNNKGLLMSQNEVGFTNDKAKGKTIFNNIRFEGAIPGFVNVKPNSDYFKSSAQNSTQFKPIPSANIGWIGYAEFNNIYIDEIRGEADDNKSTLSGIRKNVITGTSNTSSYKDLKAPFNSLMGKDYTKCVMCTDDNNAIWKVKDVSFNNVIVGGSKLDLELAKEYFYVDERSTEGIFFEGEEFFGRKFTD